MHFEATHAELLNREKKKLIVIRIWFVFSFTFKLSKYVSLSFSRRPLWPQPDGVHFELYAKRKNTNSWYTKLAD